MQTKEKRLIRALDGNTLDIPPVWMMRQAGRYLPEYRATREKAGSFLDLCYTPELAAEVTLQPIRRYGFDAAILFADILLIPQALGLDLSFVTGEGPRLSVVKDEDTLSKLLPVEEIDQTLSPVYETLRILKSELPSETALIGFAGAPWTVATYMIAGQGSKDHADSRKMLYDHPALFFGILERVTEATIHYLGQQIRAGAEVIKLFDSWASSVPAPYFEAIVIEPARKIFTALRAEFPHVKLIGFPRGAGAGYIPFAGIVRPDGLALDTSANPQTLAPFLPEKLCLQGNLDPLLMVSGGEALKRETLSVLEAFKGRPHIFNLGHGITPDASPNHVTQMLDIIRKN